MWKRTTYYLVGLGVCSAFLVGGIPPQGRPTPGGDPQAREKALHKRVEDLYNLLLGQRWSQAEKYFTEDSKENYRDEPKNPFLGFQIDSVTVNPDGQTGTAVVRVMMMTAFSPLPIEVPRASKWRLLKGLWYAQVPKVDAKALQALFASQPERGGASPARHEDLKFKGYLYNLALIQPGQIKTGRFPFTNVTDHNVTVTDVITGCKCLRVQLEKKVYKPGETGELAISFDPANYERDYAQTIIVRTSPGNLTTYLNIMGYVVPRPIGEPQPEGEKTPEKKP